MADADFTAQGTDRVCDMCGYPIPNHHPKCPGLQETQVPNNLDAASVRIYAQNREQMLGLLATTEDALWRDDVKNVLRENGYVERSGAWVKPS